MKRKKAKWKYLGTCTDGKTFIINGLNVWDYEWQNAGEGASVVDPRYGGRKDFNIFTIETDKGILKFAAGEFSNCIWGFYSPPENK